MSDYEPARVEGLPSFVVIGAQKSASTFLQEQMSQHPGIEIIAGEVRTFEDPWYSPQTVTELPSLFEGPPSLVRGIKRPDYLGRPDVTERLARHIPDATLLVVLREPIARAVSAYYHYVRHSFAPLVPINDAFTALLDGGMKDHPRAPEILEYGLYGRHLRRLQERFGHDQLVIFDQRLLTRDPGPALRRAFTAVGVDPDFTPVRPDRVSNRGVYSTLRLRVLRTKNRRLYDYAPDLSLREPRKPSPAGWVYNAAVVAADRLILSRFDSGRPAELAPAVRARLQEYYDADAVVLREVLDGSMPRPDWLS